jgi:hypothetical protein
LGIQPILQVYQPPQPEQIFSRFTIHWNEDKLSLTQKKIPLFKQGDFIKLYLTFYCCQNLFLALFAEAFAIVAHQSKEAGTHK